MKIVNAMHKAHTNGQGYLLIPCENKNKTAQIRIF